MPEKCPYCFRTLGTWTHDPILIKDGCPYTWDSETTLSYVSDITNREYKGLDSIKEEDVQEIQDKLKELEETNLDEANRTNFSPLNISGKFQIIGKHIKEMRESIEKLLTSFNLTKAEYFNYDENENHIIRPDGDKLDWTDNVVNDADWDKFQVKAIHIEDLRHNLKTVLLEKWTISTPLLINSWSQGSSLSGAYSSPYIDTARYLYFTGFLGDLGQWTTWYFPIEFTYMQPPGFPPRHSYFQIINDSENNNKYLNIGCYGDWGAVALKNIDKFPPLKESSIFQIKYNLINFDDTYITTNPISPFPPFNTVYKELKIQFVFWFYLNGYNPQVFHLTYTDGYNNSHIWNIIQDSSFLQSGSTYGFETPTVPFYNHTQTKRLDSLITDIDSIISLDFWEDFAIRLKDTYYLKDSLGIPILDEEDNLQPTTWTLKHIGIYVTADTTCPLFLTKLDDIGFVAKTV